LSKFFPSDSIARWQHPTAITASKPGKAEVLGKPKPRQPAAAVASFDEFQPNGIQKLAFALLCIYILSNLANDWSQRLFGQRAFLSLIAGVALPLSCIASGTVLRGAGYPIGKWWLAFLAWAVMAIPFSNWRGGTFAVTLEFLTKNAPLLFYVSAAAMTLSQCRKLFVANAFGGLTVILACVFFGDASSGRLMIPGSIFFDNANDLALQLLISSTFMAFLVLSGTKAVKVAGFLMFSLALLYVFKTASRANFLSMAVCFIAAFVLSRNKVRLLSVAVVIALVAAAVVPSAQWARMVYIVFNPAARTQASLSNAEAEINGDLESQMERTDLFKRSLTLTFTHPFFGVGAGQFGDVNWGEAKARGERVASLGTHNTYTQVSSEMGIPALIFFVAVLVGSIRLNLRLYRLTFRYPEPEMQQVANMAFCLLLGVLAYAVSAFFQHMAYSRQLPTLAGMSVALWAAGSQKLSQLEGNADCSGA
jgi:O-antigen ligase